MTAFALDTDVEQLRRDAEDAVSRMSLNEALIDLARAELAKREAAWFPQKGPQELLIKCGHKDHFVDEVFFGGARGGGKSDGMLGEWMAHAKRYGRKASGVMFRRNLTQLSDIIERSHALFGPMGWKWREQKKTWVSTNGARLKFRHLERDSDAEAYQGHAYTRIYCEELGNFPSDKPYKKMIACLRSAYGVPCGARSTGNPGGPGHNWVKGRFIRPVKPMTVYEEDFEGVKTTRMFIPSKLTDNPALADNDPWYRARISQSGSPELVRAWMEGDWDVVAGGMFDDVWHRDTHVISPFKVPPNWRVERVFDWGSSKPFAVLWLAFSDGDGGPFVHPPGTIFVVGEWYGCGKEVNTGIKLSDPDIGKGIALREKQSPYWSGVVPGPADNAIFPKDNNGYSCAETLKKHGAEFSHSDKSPGSRVRGWQTIRSLLSAAVETSESGLLGRNVRMEEPGIFMFSDCVGLIDTLPALPRDAKKTDDVDTESEDHLGDALRYGVASKRNRGSFGGAIYTA